ncbi:MAG TPA: metallophosphoesterase family protein, partial [bacterium]|nr:metallophosphoesterase family protein [bacterium]
MRKIHILLILVCLAAWGCASLNPAQRAGFSFTVEPAANPWTHLEFKNNPADFQFAVISDRGGGERPGIFDKTMPKINLLQPEFVMSVGDLMEGYSEDKNEVVRQWNELDGYVSQLEMPFFYVTGNHDYTNPMMAAYRQ